MKAAVTHLSEADPVLARLMARVGPCQLKVERKRSPFESLVQAVAHQQLNGKAASTILKRFYDLYPGSQFPSPEQLLATDADRLRSIGFSRSKASFVHAIAQATLDGVVEERRRMQRLGDDEIVERLTEIRGVGRWTVEMFLIFTLGRPDVLPVHDFGVRRGYSIAYGKRAMPSPAKLQAYGERWRPYRTVAAWYLWRAADAE